MREGTRQECPPWIGRFDGQRQTTTAPYRVVTPCQGRGILGVIDGYSPKGIEGDDDITHRKAFLRQIGYKLSGCVTIWGHA